MIWVWWERNEPEDGLLGFYTKSDRDNFENKKPGPYRRIISPNGETISQMDGWKNKMHKIRDILNKKIIP